jgi:hypothetical protein
VDAVQSIFKEPPHIRPPRCPAASGAPRKIGNHSVFIIALVAQALLFGRSQEGAPEDIISIAQTTDGFSGWQIRRDCFDLNPVWLTQS